MRGKFEKRKAKERFVKRKNRKGKKFKGKLHKNNKINAEMKARRLQKE
jgi:hypothetical protein